MRLLTDKQYQILNPTLPCAHRDWRDFGGFCLIALYGECPLDDRGCSITHPLRAWQRINERFARKGRRWRAIVRRYPRLAL